MDRIVRSANRSIRRYRIGCPPKDTRDAFSSFPALFLSQSTAPRWPLTAWTRTSGGQRAKKDKRNNIVSLMAGQFQRVRVPSLSLLPFLLHPARLFSFPPARSLARSRPLPLFPFPLSLSLSPFPFSLLSLLNVAPTTPPIVPLTAWRVSNMSRALPKADRARGFSARARASPSRSSLVHPITGKDLLALSNSSENRRHRNATWFSPREERSLLIFRAAEERRRGTG